jgi:energy-coupling factor transporter ATP-binding protein EcfA2
LIGYGQRVLAVGMNGSGKSELVRWLWSNIANRRALVDPKGEWRVPGVPRVTLTATTLDDAFAEVAERVDVDAPVVHVRPAWLGQPGSKEQLTALYAALDRVKGPLTVWTDEAYAVSSASWAPPGLLELQVGSRSRGHGHYVATQRPRNIAKELLTEADHVFLFPPLDVEDLVESRRGMPFLTQADALALTADVPEHGYLWVDRRARRADVGDPLPDYLRAAADRSIRRDAG